MQARGQECAFRPTPTEKGEKKGGGSRTIGIFGWWGSTSAGTGDGHTQSSVMPTAGPAFPAEARPHQRCTATVVLARAAESSVQGGESVCTRWFGGHEEGVSRLLDWGNELLDNLRPLSSRCTAASSARRMQRKGREKLQREGGMKTEREGECEVVA
eukprot:3087114-Rhodomonas_salina.4